ncbi:hypothetical protein OK351_13740 [Glutamicibacter sp. MNS18]|uniref:hypothetical protein n=1 Tax=Glutamicibacter sp. MNS18 TaxID=2989817 RepID=UPI0022359409|nr:hypothetical protein [Glutamicibacter sp. MNS18]MCW4466556.1 hypothetical protein [Glutamicibacter sp. MNS18]
MASIFLANCSTSGFSMKPKSRSAFRTTASASDDIGSDQAIEPSRRWHRPAVLQRRLDIHHRRFARVRTCRQQLIHLFAGLRGRPRRMAVLKNLGRALASMLPSG